MKYLKYFLISTVIGFTTACSNESLDDIQVNNNSIQTRTGSNPVTIPTVTKLMSCIEVDEAIINEVKVGIDRSFKYGLGYNFRFNDILKPENSKLIRSINSNHTLAEELKQAYTDLQNREKVFSTEVNFFETLANSNLIIRWPNIENWNGINKPSIGFASEDGKSFYKTTYKQDGTFTIDTIIASKEYLKENPIWIITKSNWSYDELPDFESNKFVNKDGVYFYSEYAANLMNEKSTKAQYSGLYISEMEFYDDFESKISAPGEFEFYWLSVPKGSGSCKNIMNINVDGQTGSALQVNHLIRGDWPSAERDNGLIILEKDGGKDKTGSVILRYGEENMLIPNKVTVTYPYERKDDFVLNMVWSKSILCTEGNFTPSGDLRKYYGTDNKFWITFVYNE